MHQGTLAAPVLEVIYRPGAMISQFSIYYADYYASL